MPQRTPYPMPTAAGPWGKPMALALGVHALLVLALTWGVTWQQSPAPVLDAELWSALPQVAAAARTEPPIEAPTQPPLQPAPAPQAQEPPPTPEPARAAPPDKTPAPKPDIAAEKKREEQRKAKEQKAAQAKAEKEKVLKEKAAQEKLAKELLAKKKQAQEKAEREKAEQAKAAQEQAAQEAAAREAQRREQQRQDQLQRMMGQASGKGSSSGAAAVSSGPSASYGSRVAASIKPNVVLTDPVPGNPRAEVEVRANEQGKIIERKLVKSSGNAAWDQAVLRAIDRTATLPQDSDGRVPSPLIIGLRPLD